MRDKRIYWTSVEFKLKKSHKDYNKIKGGMVYGFLKCYDSEEALNMFKEELDKNHLIPFDFEFIKPYEDVEWDNEKDNKHFQELVNDTQKCSDVILDDFYMYENY